MNFQEFVDLGVAVKLGISYCLWSEKRMNEIIIWLMTQAEWIAGKENSDAGVTWGWQWPPVNRARRSPTVLPQRSRASMLAFQLSRILTTSRWPSQAAMCSAVRPSRLMLLTSTPLRSRPSTPSASPWHAKKSSCMVASRFSGTLRSSAGVPDPTGLWLRPRRRFGSMDDCRPNRNRLVARPVRGDSSDACRRSSALCFIEPPETCRCSATFMPFAAAMSDSSSLLRYEFDQCIRGN